MPNKNDLDYLSFRKAIENIKVKPRKKRIKTKEAPIDRSKFEPCNFEFANPDTDLLMLKQIALANTEPNKHKAIKEAFYRVQMKLFEGEGVLKEKNQMRYALSIIKEKGVDIDCVEQSKDYDDFVVMCGTYGYKRIPTKDEYEVLTNYF